MKRLAVVVAIVLACSPAFAKIVVRGKIIGYDGKSKVSYSPTLEGVFAPYWHVIQPLDNGTFRIEYENEGFGNLRIYYKGMVFRFFHDADSKIYFEIKDPPPYKPNSIQDHKIFAHSDSLKKVYLVKITGGYNAINQFYNQNLRSSYSTNRLVGGDHYSHMVYRAATPSRALSVIDSLTAIEIGQIDRLPLTLKAEDPVAEAKEREIRDILRKEVYSFYGSIFLNGMSLKRSMHIRKLVQDSTANPNLYNRDWEMMVEKMLDQMNKLPPLAGSPDYIELVESMGYAMDNYQKYYFATSENESLDQYVTDRFFNYDTTLWRNDKMRFANQVAGFHMYLNNEMFYSPGLLNAINAVEEQHPNSEHIKFFQPKIDNLKNYLAKAATENTKTKVITTNYKNFDSLIKRFEGKNIFIDIWATWCGPCVEEFRYKSVVQPFVEKGNIEILYISIDKAQWDDRWRQSIVVNELEGNHFRGDKQFIADMWTAIGDERGVIPRYVLIDKQGQVFKSTAAHPSKGDELTKQIESLVARN